MGREERIAVFVDTRRRYETDGALKEAIGKSIQAQSLILEGDVIDQNAADIEQVSADIIVSRKRTFEAASEYARQGLKTAVHNFASATNPGGGVTTGAGAQEECLCRCSTLYPCLNVREMWDGFYSPHRAAHDPLHNGDIIYTPGVVVFKTDTDLPEPVPSGDWYTVDVITCAAPNLREKPSNKYNPGDGSTRVTISDDDIYKLHVKRLARIMEAACSEEVEAVVLGAFGCGAFSNPPEVAARAAHRVAEEYRSRFRVIEFAVYCRPGDDRNYRAFERELKID